MKAFYANLGLSEAILRFSQCSYLNAIGYDDPYRWCYLPSAPSAPAAPDPTATAQAQTGSNQQTALYQAGLNDVNQNTPLGDISYNINPGQTDGSGNVLQNPSTTSNITLNPGVQSALTSDISATAGEANLTNQYENQINNTLSQPYNTANAGPVPQPDAAFQQSQMNNMNALEQPFVNQSNEQLQASLAAQGITGGSQAYNNAMNTQNNSLNNLQEQNIQNATTQEQAQYGMGMTGYQQNLSNYNQNYTEPLNEFSALQSGSQVSQPSFNAAPGTSVAGTNTAGIINQSYQDALGASNASTASQNQLLGGLFGLGGSLGAAAISDRRLKTNIQRIGMTKQGIPVYRYKYKTGGNYNFGVMADEIKKFVPEAVIKGADGFFRVRYDMVAA